MRASPTHRATLSAIAPAALLCAVIVISFSPVLTAGFVYDDHHYVLGNPHLAAGWSLEGARWAFTTFYAANWHPLTWLSHLAEVSLFGYSARALHAVNLVLHALNAVLLFLFFRAATGHAGRSIFVAMLFAIHPLHVETVAWVAERKDLLATCFWFLALGAYVRQVRRSDRRGRAATLLLFAVALMAKPMPLTLPLLLLLLDIWPLGLIPVVPDAPGGPFLHAVRHRVRVVTLPLLALSVASALVTVAAQSAGGAVESLERLALLPRLGNAAISLVDYLRQSIWPAGLAVFYPHPGAGISPSRAVAAGMFLAAMSAVAVRAARRRPHLAIGWFWYLATLLPVIGIVQVGTQARADRYTYVPLVGIFVAATYEAWRVAQRRPRFKYPLAWLAVAIVGALSASSYRQSTIWKDGVTLYRHALDVAGDSWVMHSNLGEALSAQGRHDEAIGHLGAALNLNPSKPQLWFNFGTAQLLAGFADAAEPSFRRALLLQPVYPEALLNLGICLARQGRLGAAVEMYRRAIEQRPGSADANLALGLALEGLGMPDRAIERIREALRSPPHSPETAYTIGLALNRLGDQPGGISAFRETLHLAPAHPGAHETLRALGIPGGKAKER